MTALTATERAAQAERLLPYAAQLIALVHGDGGPRDIQQLLARLDPRDLTALLVVAAALADPDRPLADALGWVAFDEHGRPDRPVIVTGTVRDLAATTEMLPPPEERASVVIEVTAELARRGLGREEIAARLGITWDAVGAAHRRHGCEAPELAA
jgi:hypothetical protein